MAKDNDININNKVEKDPKLRNLQRAEDILKIVNDGVTKEEFLKAFKSVIKSVLDIEIKLVERINNKTEKEILKIENLHGEYEIVIEKVKEESGLNLANLKKRTTELIESFFIKSSLSKRLNTILEEHQTKLDETNALIKRVDNKIINVKNGEDADEEKIIESVLSQIPEVEEPIKETPTETRDKLETFIIISKRKN